VTNFAVSLVDRSRRGVSNTFTRHFQSFTIRPLVHSGERICFQAAVMGLRSNSHAGLFSFILLILRLEGEYDQHQLQERHD
jgi:hypothetical protein